MRLRVFTRLIAAAGAVLLAASAFAQSADVVVTVTPSGQTRARTAGFTYGGSKTYTVKLTNNGPSHVTSFVVDASFTAPAAPYNGAITVTPPDGCTPTTAGASPPDLPCKIVLAAPLVSGSFKEVTLSASLAKAATASKPTALSDCPTAATVVTSTISVPAVFQAVTSGTTTTDVNVDPNYGNNTVTTPLPLRPWTDLQYVSLDGPANLSEGQSVTYTGVVHNAGPCPATNTFIDFVPPSTLNFVSATGCDNNATFGPADDAGCDLASLDATAAGGFAVGDTKTFTATFTVNTLPKSVTHAAVPIDSIVSSTSPASSIAAVDDPYNSPTNATTNELTTQATLDLKNGGCATGGAGTLFGLLSLVALRLRRRKA